MKTGTNVPVSYLLPNSLRWASVPILLANEIRAIVPVFLSGLVLVLLSSVSERGPAFALAILGYGFGAAALGAVAFGHDMSHRTLGLTLTQPIRREELWRMRIRICLVAACVLAIPAGVGLGFYGFILRALTQGAGEGLLYVFLFLAAPLGAALGLGPFFTLICRSTLAGSVFTISVPFGLMLLGQWCFPIFSDALKIDENQFVFGFTMASYGVVCVAGFLAARRQFLRLEVLDSLSSPTRAEGAKWNFRLGLGARTPVWMQLAWKEVRLQGMSLVPAIGMVATSFALGRPDAAANSHPSLLLSIALWAVAMCVIMGAVGSAEERQIGVTEMQAVQPRRRSMQWLVKVAVVSVLAQLLAVALPLWLITVSAIPREGTVPELRWWCITAFSVSSLALFVSSCSRTTIQAILWTLPLTPPVLVALSFAHEVESRLLTRPDADPFSWGRTELQVPYVLLAVASLLLLKFGCANHFSAEVGGRRLAGQILGLIVVSGAVCVLGVAWGIRAASSAW